MATQPTNWLEIAKRRFPTHVVGGDGRFALYTPACGPMGKILLFETRDAAAAMIVDAKQVQIVDLAHSPVPRIRDDAEDRAWEKRYSRERKNA